MLQSRHKSIIDAESADTKKLQCYKLRIFGFLSLTGVKSLFVDLQFLVISSAETSTASFSDATAYAFLSSQPQGSQLVHEDLEQIHDDDLEEMDLKWNMALLSMRARKFYQRTGGDYILLRGLFEFQEAKGQQKLEPRKLIKKNKIEDASEKAMCAIDGGCQVTDKSKKGFGYNAVPSPSSLILTGPSPLVFVLMQVLRDFQQPEKNWVMVWDYIQKQTTMMREEVKSIPRKKRKLMYLLATEKESFYTHVSPSRERSIRHAVFVSQTVSTLLVDAQGTCLETLLTSQISKNLMEDLLLLVEEQMEEESLVKVLPYFEDIIPQSVDDVQLQGQDGTHDDSSFQEDGIDDHQVNTASPQVNTASPQVNTGSRELSTADYAVNTATSEGINGTLHTMKITRRGSRH
ncbi:hypothetical protein Tco_0198793 [Tanacetum coccineum]